MPVLFNYHLLCAIVNRYRLRAIYCAMLPVLFNCHLLCAIVNIRYRIVGLGCDIAACPVSLLLHSR